MAQRNVPRAKGRPVFDPILGLTRTLDSPTVVGGGATGVVPPPFDHHTQLTDFLHDDHTQYLLLAGRTGTTNDPTISTDGDGTIMGSKVSGGRLLLMANPVQDAPIAIEYPGRRATFTDGPNEQIYGAAGGPTANNVTMTIVNDGPSQPLSVSVVGQAVTIHLATDGGGVITTTVGDLFTFINTDAAFVAVPPGGVNSTQVPSFNPTDLASTLSTQTLVGFSSGGHVIAAPLAGNAFGRLDVLGGDPAQPTLVIEGVAGQTGDLAEILCTGYGLVVTAKGIVRFINDDNFHVTEWFANDGVDLAFQMDGDGTARFLLSPVVVSDLGGGGLRPVFADNNGTLVPGSGSGVGPPGMDGLDGIDGLDGMPGLPGATGATGATGARGPQGLMGMPGDEGPPGEDGVPGVPGAPGATGAAGLNAPIIPGFDGTDGDDGLLVVGPVGATGAAGSTGATGPQGAQGFPGFPGLDGADGSDSLVPGPTGNVGAQGTTGAPGVQGPMGPPGVQPLDPQAADDEFVLFPGVVGPTGPQGPTGSTGAQGAMGPPGVQPLDPRSPDDEFVLFPGVQGPVGATGATGNTGQQGAPGPGPLFPDTFDEGEITVPLVPDLTPYLYKPGLAGGQTANGGTGASDGLTLQSTSHATRGSISLVDPTLLYTSNATVSGVAQTVYGLQTNAAFTLSGTLAGYTMIGMTGTVTDTGAALPVLFSNTALFDRTTTTNAANFSGLTAFLNQPTIRANGVALTGGTANGFNDNPTFSIANAGTLTGATYNAMQSSFTAGASATIDTRRGLLVNNATGAGSVTNQIAIEIAALAKGGTLNVGIRSAIAASAGKNYFLRDTGGADSILKGQLRLGDTTDPTALFDVVGKTTLNTSGLVTKYNNVATVSDGIPSEVATIDLTTQGAAITASTLYAVPAAGAGMYRVTWVATVTRAASTSSVLGGTAGFQVKYTEGAVVKTMPGTIVAGVDTNSTNSTATGTISGCFVGFVDASTAIQYQMDYTSVGVTTMQFSLHVKCEAL